MKIRIYIASSEELTEDKIALGSVISRLDEICTKFGMNLEKIDSDELLDDADKRNDLKNSQMFVALFHKEANEVTINEFEEATELLKNHKSPLVYVYCKDLTIGEVESDELANFKKKLFDEMGHYWCRYGNEDTLKLHLIMQILQIDSDNMPKLEVSDGKVRIGMSEVANLENVQFVANNTAFQKKKAKLAELKTKVEKLRVKIERHPNDEDYRYDLDDVLREYNNLKKEIEDDEKYIFETALVIAKLQQKEITDRMRRAMDAFDNGDVIKANDILDEAAHDANNLVDKIKKDKQILEYDKESGRKSVDELIFSTKVMMADVSKPMRERIEKTKEIYETARDLALECDYDKAGYAKLLYDYAFFLQKLNRHKEALKYYEESIEIGKQLIVSNSPKYRRNLAQTLNNLAILYKDCNDFEKAEQEYLNSLEIIQMLSKENPNAYHSDLAQILNNLANFHIKCKNYSKAEREYIESLQIVIDLVEKNYSAYRAYMAQILNNLANLNKISKKNNLAERRYDVSLKIRRDLVQENSVEYLPDLAQTLNNLANLHSDCHKFEKAEQEYLESIAITRKLSKENPDAYFPNLAQALNNIANMHQKCKKYEKAEQEYFEAIGITKNLVENNRDVYQPYLSQILNNLAKLFNKNHKYNKAEQMYIEALEIRKKISKDNPNVYQHDLASTLNGLAYNYAYQQKFSEALSSIDEAISLMPENPHYYDSKGEILLMMNDEENARKMYEKVLELDSEFYKKTQSSLGEKFGG